MTPPADDDVGAEARAFRVLLVGCVVGGLALCWALERSFATPPPSVANVQPVIALPEPPTPPTVAVLSPPPIAVAEVGPLCVYTTKNGGMWAARLSEIGQPDVDGLLPLRCPQP